MGKKYAIIIALIGALAVGGFAGAGIYMASDAAPTFTSGGYILGGEEDQVKTITFQSGKTYSATLSNSISFENADGEKSVVPRESFVYLDDGSVMAMSDGILLDFNDLSDNFINNYYLKAGLTVTEAGGEYTAETSAGTMKFGENLWKLSERKYIVQSPVLKVHFAEDDVREVNDYVQVVITEDNVVHLLTPENIWMTISENCYIETQNGVKVYPVRQLVDNDDYKLSLAKLAVTTDEAITLTQDETRRQIVPELNIDAVDGADGDDGEDGQSGQAGESGVSGEDGADGADGENGSQGVTGANGANGTRGSSGSDGGSGANGTNGANGSGGRNGSPGTGGKDAVVESSTNSALPTMSISEWKVSGSSLKGTIKAPAAESFIAIKDLENADSYPGRITITNTHTGQVIDCYHCDDETHTLDLQALSRDFYDYYNGTEDIYFSTLDKALEPDTEYRLSVTAYYKATDETNMIYSREFISRVFYTDSAGVVMAYSEATPNQVTLTASISPSYEGSVAQATAYLLTPDQNETFNASSVDSLSNYVAAQTIDFNENNNTQGTVTFTGLAPNTRYLTRVYVKSTSGLNIMTREAVEAKTLKRPPTCAPGSKVIANYNRLTGGYEVWRPLIEDLDSGAVSYTYYVYAKPLPAESSTPDSAGTLSVQTLDGEAPAPAPQELPAEGQVLTADENSGEMSTQTESTALEAETDGSGEVMLLAGADTPQSGWTSYTKRTVSAQAGEPVVFHLDSGHYYYFSVEMEFFDNEKTVYYDLGDSDPLVGIGDSMPRMDVVSTASKVTYDSFKGTIRIYLGKQSKLEVMPSKPLILQVFAEQVINKEIAAGNPENINAAEHYKVTLPASTNTNQYDINLELTNLYKNTQYTVTLIGNLDVGDGNGFQRRTIGTISFMTKATKPLQAVWSTPASYSTSFARTLKLDTNPALSEETPNSQGQEESGYALDQLKKGQVTVELYSGTGTGKLRLAQANFNKSEDLNALYGPGLQIDEIKFGSPPLDPKGNYTLTVSAVADETYAMYDKLKYTNTFEEIKNPSEVVSADPIPPDLLTDSSKGVIAEPIRNEYAVRYGGKVDESLPDDAVVGFALTATYDNVQRIGKTITYYAYEYNTFFNALSSSDPLEVAAPLMKMTQKIDPGSDMVPQIALWFGGTKTPDDQAVSVNGYTNYYAGSPLQEGESLRSGMGRGYRYIFAYTVNYAGSSTGDSEVIKVYPYDHPQYESYKNLHGGVRENNTQKGNRVAYILNSGMCSVPLMMPDFHTYVYSNTADSLTSHDSPVGSGTVTLHYTWREREPDPLVKYNLPDDLSLSTNITIPSVTGNPDDVPVKIAIDKTKVPMEDDWYQVTIPYRVTNTNNVVLTPTINISEYLVPYNPVLDAFGMKKDTTDYPLAQIPVEFPWTKRFEREYGADGSAGGAARNRAYLSMDMSEQNLEKNYINFFIRYDDSRRGDSLADRAVALELHFQVRGDPKTAKSFLLPIIRDVNGDYAKLVTGRLGPEYLSFDTDRKVFEVTDAKLWYDSGIQGWDIAEKDGSKGFALQYINQHGNHQVFNLSNYIGAINSSLAPANGAMLVTSGFEVSQLRDVLDMGTGSTQHQGDHEKDQKLHLYYQNKVAGDGNATYLYPDHLGIDLHNSSNADQRSGQYAVPKQLLDYPMLFEGDSESQEGELRHITPTVEHTNISASSTAIEINGLRITGFKEGGTVRMAVYRNQENAINLDTQYVGSPNVIQIGKDGRPTDPSSVRFDQFHAEDANNKFFVTFYYTYLSADGYPVNVHLLDSATAYPAIYSVTLSSNATIDITNLEYQNISYFDKNLTLDYTISRIFNLKMSYDIFDSQDKADNYRLGSENNAPILDYATLKGTGTDGILTEPSVLEYSNKVKIDLKPSVARKALQPGHTYYLRVTAYEVDNDGNPTSQAGYAVKPFELTTVGNYGALIYVAHASNNSITYRVTINDPQFSFMTRNGTEGGLYAVRFTDGKGHRLYTTYDDMVFSANEVRKEFVLDDSTLLNDKKGLLENTQITKDTVYWMNIYAVPDTDHDGVVTVGSEDKIWSDFFDKAAAELKDCGTRFLDIVSGFWRNDLKPDTSKKDAEDVYRVAAKEQKTTTDQNWLLNENGIYANRFNSTTTRIIFEESFGLVSKDGSHVFKRITWSVEGKTNDGMPMSASGDLRLSNNDGDKLLKSGTDSGGYSIFYFDIPYEIGQGNYTIILQFRTNEDSPAPDKTITIRSGV